MNESSPGRGVAVRIAFEITVGVRAAAATAGETVVSVPWALAGVAIGPPGVPVDDRVSVALTVLRNAACVAVDVAGVAVDGKGLAVRWGTVAVSFTGVAVGLTGGLDAVAGAFVGDDGDDACIQPGVRSDRAPPLTGSPADATEGVNMLMAIRLSTAVLKMMPRTQDRTEAH